MAMRIDQFTFGSIRIDGVIYEHDVVIARGRVRKRKKKSSNPFRGAFGHTPLSIEESIPWDCRRLVVGTGADGALPVMDEVKREAARREVALLTVPTREAIRALEAEPKGHERDLARNLLMRGCRVAVRHLSISASQQPSSRALLLSRRSSIRRDSVARAYACSGTAGGSTSASDICHRFPMNPTPGRWHRR
jgi:hypothetical protein